MGLISDGQARGLAAWARSHKSKAASIHHRAIELREALYALFRRGTDVRRDLDVVNREATDLASAVRLDITSDGYSINWEQGSEILGPILLPVSLHECSPMPATRADFVVRHIAIGEVTKGKEAGICPGKSANKIADGPHQNVR